MSDEAGLRIQRVIGNLAWFFGNRVFFATNQYGLRIILVSSRHFCHDGGRIETFHHQGETDHETE